MKINYNGFKPMPKRACDIILGQAFEYENWYYMPIHLKCVNLDVKMPSNLMPIVNLHSATVRLIPRDSDVYPLQSKVQLRQGHTHEELNECDEERPLG